LDRKGSEEELNTRHHEFLRIHRFLKKQVREENRAMNWTVSLPETTIPCWSLSTGYKNDEPPKGTE
jgi:hypothetical protein